MLKRIGDIVMIQLSDIDSNIYIMGDTAIDAGTGFNFTRLATILRVLKLGLGDIKQVINTHGHFDHIGGDGYFINAKVSIHGLDAPIMESADQEKSMADFFDGKLNPRKPDTILKEGDRIKILGYDFEVLHTPGHTSGSICLFDNSTGLLVSGDTIFSDGVGRTDVPGGDPEALDKSLEKISKLDAKKILPGHGDPVHEKGKKVIEEILSAGPAPEEEAE